MTEEARRDAERRYHIFKLSVFAIVPAIATFAVHHLMEARTMEGIPMLGVAAAMAATIPILARLSNGAPVYRAVVVLTLAFLIYEVADGGGHGFAYVWLFILPTLMFFLFGLREGIAWTAGALLACVPFLYGVGEYNYPANLSARIMVAYAIVGLLAFGQERSRAMTLRRLLEEKQTLQDKIAQVKQLSGLIPICASCKKIRDDQGYWNRIETYLLNHSEAQLSHGICPECMEQLYGETPG